MADPREYADPEEFARDLDDLAGRLAEKGNYLDGSLARNCAELIRALHNDLEDAQYDNEALTADERDMIDSKPEREDD